MAPTLIPPRILWDKLVDKAILDFEEATVSSSQFLTSMVRLGFEKQDVINLIDGKEEC